ncbi:MerR family transcriptional regulator [Amycolatopsis anabasis]|uniref:MerR family transcriptional regulator n=1 Tax=Amycolatopsis anabasis TaxID=1840409 RepID=UPI00131BC1A2|nr:MerR family transcriptional regulator [Amycolatopsis anabasis]
MDPELSIGVFARRSRLSLKALRLYDRLGLLTPTRVDERNGYRWYRESQLVTARLVVMLRRLDMPLTKIAEIVSAPSRLGAELLASYWTDAERRFSVQRELVEHLRNKLEGKVPTGFDIRQREVPEQLVLAEQRHTKVDQLSCWIGSAMGRLGKAATDHGGVTGHPFVVYYGEVSEDSDGPVEACLPIDLGQAGAKGVAMRLEPAHREVYTVLRRAQVEFPQILSAYDRVMSWIGEQELVVDGAPREIYLGDFMTADPEAEICELAFPIR